ncbi:LysR family transcriptional regulator [Pseudoalteromonas xiamenensis]|uniref:LysR family transcriptional regulator n=1 Tax=Pseudoalteromonas xiamenensis TaxID=882626 RepID=UPI0027E531EF|nr:LysR family transcriptional regulator [Pseudoalteromonas xiamenensis]WMN58951.1 LysR family transcriptional regulator [Pseudoalteromonas xiamenensis]
MTINNLFEGIPVFVQVVKSRGFGAAADVLGYSSSHVSKTINKLEGRLGVRLMNRTTRTLALTPEGEAFYQQCLLLMQEAENALNLVNQEDQIPKGELKISCPIGLAHSHLEPILANYLHKYPNVSLDLDLSDKHIDLIAEGYDLVIRATAQLPESSLICKKIYATEIITVASIGYIERFGRPHHPRELSQHHCICYSNLKTPGRWLFTHKNGETFDVNVKQKIRCNNGQMETQMVRSGLGISRLPKFYLKEALDKGELEILFEDFERPEVSVYALYPSRKHLSAKVRRFIDMLSEELT